MSAAIRDLKGLLTDLQQKQAECETTSGYVKPHMRYRYKILVEKCREVREAIETLEQMYRV